MTKRYRLKRPVVIGVKGVPERWARDTAAVINGALPAVGATVQARNINQRPGAPRASPKLDPWQPISTTPTICQETGIDPESLMCLTNFCEDRYRD